MDLKQLTKPFPPNDVEWRIQQAGFKNGKPWALVLAYVTNRAIQERLDDVVGPENWQNHFRDWRGGGVLCGIAIRVSVGVLHQRDNEWITKWDGAEDTNIEAVKGGLSSAMKRAAVQWGIGRYLYGLDVTFAECSTHSPYSNAEKQKGWNRHYDKTEKKTFWWKIPTLPNWALPTAAVHRQDISYPTDVIPELPITAEAAEAAMQYAEKVVAPNVTPMAKGVAKPTTTNFSFLQEMSGLKKQVMEKDGADVNYYDIIEKEVGERVKSSQITSREVQKRVWNAMKTYLEGKK